MAADLKPGGKSRVKRVLMGCCGALVLSTLGLAAWIMWILNPSGKPIQLFVDNGWHIPIEVRINDQTLTVAARSRIETTVQPGPVHISTRNPATGAVLENLDEQAVAQTRIGRWSDERVERRSRFYIYNPGARRRFKITDHEYSTISVPRFGGPRTEEIRGERWILAERIGFAFTPATRTHKILTSRRDQYASITVRGISSEPDTYYTTGDPKKDPEMRTALAAALAFDPNDPELWEAQYEQAVEAKDAPMASKARQEMLRLNCAALDADPCDENAASVLERLSGYWSNKFPEDKAFVELRREASACLARRKPCMKRGETQ